MQTLSSTLSAAQKAGGQRLSKIVLTFSPSAWAASTAYTLGERVEPTSANTYLYECIIAGTSHSSEPTFPITVGGTVLETGGVKWKNIGLKSQTYTRTGATGRILSIEPDLNSTESQRTTVVLNNYDQALSNCDLKGFQAIISRGYVTSVGDEYQASPTQWVIGQSDYSLRSGRSLTQLDLIGIPDLLAQDKANADYEPDITNTDTVKDIATAVLEATLGCFDHCQAFTVVGGSLVIDWEDALFDSYVPKDTLNIRYGESRLDVLNRLLSLTRMVWRAETGGEIHLFAPYRIEDKETWAATHAYEYDDIVEPTTPNGYLYTPEEEGSSDSSEPTWPTTIGGTVQDDGVKWVMAYHYEYEIADKTKHTFYNASSMKNIVIPGYMKVESYPDSDGAEQYSGTAQDDGYDTYPTALKIQDFKRVRTASSAEAANLATAILRGYQSKTAYGSATVMMNVGQEVYDLVRIYDLRTGETWSGLIQSITRRDTIEDFDMTISFTSVRKDLSGLIIPSSAKEEDRYATWTAMKKLAEIVTEVLTSHDERLDMTERLVQSNWETFYFRDRPVSLIAVGADTALTVADGHLYWTVPNDLDGYLLVDADAAVNTASSSGTPTFQIHNLTDTNDMLSTRITIDVNEKNSYSATAQPVIDQAKDDVAAGDILRFDCDVTGTGTKGLEFLLKFRKA